MDPGFETIAGIGGVPLRVALAGKGPLVVCVHGFPEGWQSWRGQMRALSEAGYMVAAMDVRGYGGSGQPAAIDAYDMSTMTGDVASVIAALGGGDPAVLVGHDWGAPMVWNTALVHPDRVRAVAGMSIPHLPAGARSLLNTARQLFTDKGRFFYITYFQEPGVAEAELEADPRTTLAKLTYAWSGDAPRGLFHTDKPVDADLLSDIPAPERLPDWVDLEDFDAVAAGFARTGFRGPLNRYRNFERDRVFLTGLARQTISQPAAFIAGTEDPALRMFGFDPVDAMRPHIEDLRAVHMIEGAGHWVQREAEAEVNAALLAWLNGL